MCKAKKVDIDAVKAIGSTIIALNLRKNMFQEDLKRAGASQVERLRRAEYKKASAQVLNDLVDSIGLDSVTMLDRDGSVAAVSPGAIH